MTAFVHPAPYPLSTERLSLTDLVDSDFALTYVMDTNDEVMRYIGVRKRGCLTITTRSSRSGFRSGLARSFICGLCVCTGVSASSDGR